MKQGNKNTPKSKNYTNTVNLWLNPWTSINRMSVCEINSAQTFFCSYIPRQNKEYYNCLCNFLPHYFCCCHLWFGFLFHWVWCLGFFMLSPVFPTSSPFFYWCGDVWKLIKLSLNHHLIWHSDLNQCWFLLALTWWFVSCDGSGSNSHAVHWSVSEDGDLQES